MNSLERLNEWTDLDIAMHELAILTGIINDEFSNFAKYKKIYWTDNEHSRFLDKILKNLIEFKILEIDEYEEKVRRNPEYKSEKLLE